MQVLCEGDESQRRLNRVYHVFTVPASKRRLRRDSAGTGAGTYQVRQSMVIYFSPTNDQRSLNSQDWRQQAPPSLRLGGCSSSICSVVACGVSTPSLLHY